MSTMKELASLRTFRSTVRHFNHRNHVSWQRGHKSAVSSAGRLEPDAKAPQLPPHSLLPTKMLLRSFLVATISSHRFLLTPALKLLSLIAHSSISILDVNRNPVLRAILKSTFYNHFCAGENGKEVQSTIRNIKDMGFKGVILTYAREIVVDASKEKSQESATATKTEDSTFENSKNSDIEAWRQGVLETVEMVGKGDILALKLTGAGEPAMRALLAKEPLPAQMMLALEEICARAVERGARIFIDAEQQSVQPAIDDIAIDLMAKFNVDGKVVVYNTYQAYLKITPSTLLTHLDIASKRKFTLGVKLVRGAYINSEPRAVINDTKSDTDDSYNAIAEGVIKCVLGPFGKGKQPFPSSDLFLATHNKESALLANKWVNQQISAGLPVTKVQYGQLLGMADGVSCKLLQVGEANEDSSTKLAPEVFKCLSWGTLGDCLSYLLRRAVENRDAVGRTREEYLQLRQEIFRRMRNISG